MERATVMKTLHGNLIPKPQTNMIDRDASFSSYNHHQHHDANIGSGRCRFVDDSANELSIFDAHKYFNNEVITTNNDIHQKVTMISTSRVSPVANMDSSTGSNNNNVVVAEKGVGGGDTIENTTRYSSASSSMDGGYANMRNYRALSFHGGAATPTASSEASWNSQAALLTHHHPKKNAARGSHDATMPVAVSMRDPQNSNDLNKKLKASLSKPIWILRRKCPCTGRKAVLVKENNTTTQHKPPQLVPKPPPQQQHDHETKSMIMNPKDNIRMPIIAPNSDWVVESSSSKSQRFHQHRAVASSSVRVQFSDGFTFPVLSPNPSSLNPKVLLRADQNGVASGSGAEEQPPRDSLEVFQPLDHDPVEPTSDPPRPLAANGIGGGDDDVASDASSDLFEIESFSTAGAAAQPTCPVEFRSEQCKNGGGNGFFYGSGGRRRSADEGSTVTECYAPSEVSVEWSVTTAEGYCYEESIAGDGGANAAAAAAAEKWRRKVSSSSSSSSGNGLLSGCRSEKAVSVGPQPVRKCEGQRGATGTSCGGWRHEHEHEHVIVSSNGGGNSCGSSRVATLGKPPLARPHNTNPNTSSTPRMSLAFAA